MVTSGPRRRCQGKERYQRIGSRGSEGSGWSEERTYANRRRFACDRGLRPLYPLGSSGDCVAAGPGALAGRDERLGRGSPALRATRGAQGGSWFELSRE